MFSRSLAVTETEHFAGGVGIKNGFFIMAIHVCVRSQVVHSKTVVILVSTLSHSTTDLRLGNA